MNTELKTALEILEKEKDISKDVMLDAIENSLITACQSHFGKEKENFRVEINRDTCDFHVYAEKTVVEQVEDPDTQISLAEAKLLDKKYELGDIVRLTLAVEIMGRYSNIILVDENGKIVSVSVPENSETPGLGADLIADQSVFDALVGQDIATAQIDVKSGVTLTSNAINDALGQAAKEVQ